MKKVATVKTKRRAYFAAMSDNELENWFAALDFEVEVVANCDDISCPNCRTVEPARAA